MREAMDKQRLQQPLHVVERVTHTGEAGKSTDTCIEDHYHTDVKRAWRKRNIVIFRDI